MCGRSDTRRHKQNIQVSPFLSYRNPSRGWAAARWKEKNHAKNTSKTKRKNTGKTTPLLIRMYEYICKFIYNWATIEVVFFISACRFLAWRQQKTRTSVVVSPQGDEWRGYGRGGEGRGTANASVSSARIPKKSGTKTRAFRGVDSPRTESASRERARAAALQAARGVRAAAHAAFVVNGQCVCTKKSPSGWVLSTAVSI